MAQNYSRPPQVPIQGTHGPSHNDTIKIQLKRRENEVDQPVYLQTEEQQDEDEDGGFYGEANSMLIDLDKDYMPEASKTNPQSLLVAVKSVSNDG